MKGQKKKFVKIFLFTFLTIITIVLLTALFSPILKINYINVSGNKYYSQEEIVEVSEISVGKNILTYLNTNFKALSKLRLEKNENKIDELPYVKEAIVTYKFMEGIDIEIEERQPVAYLPYISGYLLMDEEGVIVESKSGDFPQTLIGIKGLEIQSYVLGKKIKTKVDQTSDAIVLVNTIIQSDNNSRQHIFDSIDWIDVSSSKEILISLENRIIVNIGDVENVGYKVEYTKQIFFVGLPEHERGLVDFTKQKNPGFTPET